MPTEDANTRSVEREQRIAELEREVAVMAQALVQAHTRQGELEALVERLEKKIADFTAKASQNSTNSSLPPSSDSKGLPKPRKRPKTGKKRGGQKGHAGHHRALLSPDKVDTVVDLYPSACEGCGTSLPKIADVDPQRMQEIELPPIKPQVTEFRLHEVACGCCFHRTRAVDEHKVIPVSPFGPRLMATIALLTGVYHLTRRNAGSVLSDLVGVKISLGAISTVEGRVSNALKEPVEEACARVNAAAVKHTDGTSWQQAGVARSLWTIACSVATVFKIVLNGSSAVLSPLFGTMFGILISDRASALNFWVMNRRQICWAHLIRKFVAYSEMVEPAAAIGRELLACAGLTFGYWHEFKNGLRTREQLRASMVSVQEQIREVLQRGVDAQLRRLSKSCKNVLDHAAALWTFLVEEGVEPTNNHAERELRPVVLWRKRSFGSQSERGDRFAERILSVAHTARKQKLHVLEFLTRCCRSYLDTTAAPTLFAT